MGSKAFKDWLVHLMLIYKQYIIQEKGIGLSRSIAIKKNPWNYFNRIISGCEWQFDSERETLQEAGASLQVCLRTPGLRQRHR